MRRVEYEVGEFNEKYNSFLISPEQNFQHSQAIGYLPGVTCI
jgi:hypothetical protein